MNELEHAAEVLRRYAETETDHRFTTDSMLALEAVRILDIDLDGETLGAFTDSCECCEENCGLHYVLPEDEGGETLCIRDGKVYVGSIEHVKSQLNADYAEKHGKVICKCCGSFERRLSGKADCESCGNLVDAIECLTSEQLEENLKNALPGFEDLGDGDYEHVWLLKERLATHETKSNHSYVFLRVMYMDQHKRDPDVKFCGEVIIVNIGMAGKAAVLEINEEWGLEGKVEPKWIAKELMSKGICATVIQESGNSKIDVLQRIARRMSEVTVLGGFALDRVQNALGATGWDFMKGDPLAGVKRWEQERAYRIS